jgi:hypothetical protein
MKHLANFSQTWYKLFLQEGEIQVYPNESPSPLQRGDNQESAKIG